MAINRGEGSNINRDLKMVTNPTLGMYRVFRICVPENSLVLGLGIMRLEFKLAVNK